MNDILKESKSFIDTFVDETTAGEGRAQLARIIERAFTAGKLEGIEVGLNILRGEQ